MTTRQLTVGVAVLSVSVVVYGAAVDWVGAGIMASFLVAAIVLRIVLDWIDRRWEDRSNRPEIEPQPKPDPVHVRFYLNHRSVHDDMRSLGATPRNRLWHTPSGNIILPIIPSDRADAWFGYHITSMSYHSSCDALEGDALTNIMRAADDIAMRIERNG